MIAFIDDHRKVHEVEPICRLLPIAPSTCYGYLTERAAFLWGQDRGHPEASPLFGISSPHKGRGGATPWTEEDEAHFLRRHGPGTMAKRWFYLAKNTAGRIGDTHLLGPKNILLEGRRAFLA